MRSHWAPRLWGPAPLGPRAMVFRWIVDFFQIPLSSRIQYKWIINLIVNKKRSR